MLNDPKAFTRHGNMRSPGYVRVMKWIIECWNELDRDLIRNSFDGTGITCSNKENFNSVLRFVLVNGHMPGRILQDKCGDDDLVGFNHVPDDDETGDISSKNASSEEYSTQELSSDDNEGPKTSKKTVRYKSS